MGLFSLAYFARTTAMIDNPDHPEVRYEDITYKEVYNFLSCHREAFSDDLNFVSFYEAMERHTFETISEYMKHEMEDKFYTRIKEATK